MAKSRLAYLSLAYCPELRLQDRVGLQDFLKPPPIETFTCYTFTSQVALTPDLLVIEARAAAAWMVSVTLEECRKDF